MAAFSRSQIMKAAWTNYRRWHAVRESIQGPLAFDRKEFAWKLRCAWDQARQAALTPVQRRAEAIRAEIDGLKFKSFKINTTPMLASRPRRWHTVCRWSAQSRSMVCAFKLMSFSPLWNSTALPSALVASLERRCD